MYDPGACLSDHCALHGTEQCSACDLKFAMVLHRALYGIHFENDNLVLSHAYIHIPYIYAAPSFLVADDSQIGERLQLARIQHMLSISQACGSFEKLPCIACRLLCWHAIMQLQTAHGVHVQLSVSTLTIQYNIGWVRTCLIMISHDI